MADRLDLARIRASFAALQQPSVLDEPGARAAVAIVLRESDVGAEALFIRRAEDPRDPWSGHIAFPGGRADPEDRGDLLVTAMRETSEEIGLSLHGAERIGRLPDLPAIARGRRVGLTISPFVFAIEGSPTLVPNVEVAETIWAPIEPFLAGTERTLHPYVFEGKPMKLPAHRLGERVVWGLTYQMLEVFLSIVRDA